MSFPTRRNVPLIVARSFSLIISLAAAGLYIYLLVMNVGSGMDLALTASFLANTISLAMRKSPTVLVTCFDTAAWILFSLGAVWQMGYMTGRGGYSRDYWPPVIIAVVAVQFVLAIFHLILSVVGLVKLGKIEEEVIQFSKV